MAESHHIKATGYKPKRGHGHAIKGQETVEYRTWATMKKRCFNRNCKGFARYGGRGIKVCERWLGPHGFVNFLSDMRARPSAEHSIERIDNSGDYTPENCRWATRKEQARNRRDNLLVTHQGETKTVAEWSEITGIPVKRLYSRLRRGALVEKVFSSEVPSAKESSLKGSAVRTASARTLTINGVTKTLREWSKTSGTKLTTIERRLQRGWPLAEAVFAAITKYRRGGVSQWIMKHLCEQ